MPKSPMESRQPPSHVLALLEAQARAMAKNLTGTIFDGPYRPDILEPYLTTWLARAYTNDWSLELLPRGRR